jgi:hypothetical protein
MVFDAFCQRGGTGEEDAQSGVVLSKQDIVARCLASNPEFADPAKRKNLVNGIGIQLKERAIKADEAGRWSLPPDFMELRTSVVVSSPQTIKRKASIDDADLT